MAEAAPTRLSGRLRFLICGDSALCVDARSRGFESFEQLAEYVRKLPYGRTSNAQEPLAVLRQGRGTCSAKHQLLAVIAQDCGHSEVQLTAGIYEMSEENTPGKEAIAAWASERGIPKEAAWAAREACITALAADAAID
jgi:hypothetical protein